MSDVHDFGFVDWDRVPHATCRVCGVQRRVRSVAVSDGPDFRFVEYRHAIVGLDVSLAEGRWQSERIPCVSARSATNPDRDRGPAKPDR